MGQAALTDTGSVQVDMGAAHNRLCTGCMHACMGEVPAPCGASSRGTFGDGAPALPATRALRSPRLCRIAADTCWKAVHSSQPTSKARRHGEQLG